MSNIEKVDKYEIFKLKYIKNSEFVGNFDKGNQKIVFDIPKSILEKVDSITLNCKETSSSSDWIFLETAELK